MNGYGYVPIKPYLQKEAATWIWPTAYSLPTPDIKAGSTQLKLGQLSRVVLAPELAVGPAGVGAELQGSATSSSAHACSFPSFPSLGQFLRNVLHAFLRVRVHFKGNPPCTSLNLGVVCYIATDDIILNWVCL